MDVLGGNTLYYKWHVSFLSSEFVNRLFEVYCPKGTILTYCLTYCYKYIDVVYKAAIKQLYRAKQR